MSQQHEARASAPSPAAAAVASAESEAARPGPSPRRLGGNRRQAQEILLSSLRLSLEGQRGDQFSSEVTQKVLSIAVFRLPQVWV